MTTGQTGQISRTVRSTMLAAGVALLVLCGVDGAPRADAADGPGVEQGATAGRAVRNRRTRHTRATRQRSRQAPIVANAVAEARAAEDYAGAVVSAEELQEMRGGFIGRSGMTVRFGFDIATHVNGALQQRLVLAPTDIGVNTANVTLDRTNAQGQTTQHQLGLGGTSTEFRDALNGGATTISTSLSSRGIVSAVQNSANNQVIQRSATINLEVTGLRAVMNNNSAHRFVGSALGARSVFGR